MTIGKLPLANHELWWLREGEGAHGDDPLPPALVVEALSGRFRFVEETEDAVGLRPPQLGAVHAILAHRSMEDFDPITVVMPTGTGKTETMLAAYCHAPRRTLVIVPSDALRTQIATKFATLGVLPQVGAVTGNFLCPSVLLVKGGVATAEQVDEMGGRANVIVATAQALATWPPDARERLGELCDRLYVDEAHHVAARTWREVADLFVDKEVIQFTATPYREDGQHLGGKVAYAYPLRLAQKNGYFAKINYRSILDLADPDRAVAAAAVGQLRADLEAGYDHLLMARCSSVKRSKEVLELYEEIAADLGPIRLDTGYAESTRTRLQAKLDSRESRIVVCVNMLGEGFDLPSLKVAALHDPQKSLAVTLQFIGRFTRVTGADLGDASAFVPLQALGVDDRLRRLYSEDADWNEVIQDLTERAVGREKERSDFERAFTSLPVEVALQSIHPKMSTVTYRSASGLKWTPENIDVLFEDRLLTTRAAINNQDKVVWWVSREDSPVRWGDISVFSELVHHLYVVHVDDQTGFLYINSSNNASLHEDVAEAVGGPDVELVSGETVYRILSKVERRVPTNVGLLDAVSHTRRFSMHVGQDVLFAWQGEGGTKMKTNIFAHGYSAGTIVSFGASRKGRVWSHEEADGIYDWVQWARQIGPVITDTSIDLDSVMSGFLLPELATTRPELVPLAIEWPYHIIATLSERRQLTHDGHSFSLMEAELRVITHDRDSPVRFEIATPGWQLQYEYKFRPNDRPSIHPVGADAQVGTPTASIGLAAFMNREGMLLTFEDEAVIVERGYLLRPQREKLLFPRTSIEALDWAGIDLRRESQGADHDPTSIQYRTIELLSAETEWEVVVDDDGSGELADVVFLRRVGGVLQVLLAHCKFSTEPTPGARIKDLYDVCGQAIKMNRAKSMPQLLTGRLLLRETKRQQQGRSGLIVGTAELLTQIVNEARFLELRTTVAIVQPGMSAAQASDDMLALLGGTQRFLSETHGTVLRVIASQ